MDKKNKLKLLNLGCGDNYHKDWINIDFNARKNYVKGYNLLKGIPFKDNEFDTIYTSHLLEHFSKSDAVNLLKECFRVLKSNGIIRIVVPDLECIAENYLNLLSNLKNGNKDDLNNYEWILLELYDQTVRSFSGGEMGKYLLKSNLANKDFILSRFGIEAENFWNNANKKPVGNKIKFNPNMLNYNNFRKLKYKTCKYLTKLFIMLFMGKEYVDYFEEGVFRNSGEIHKWMYDRFSLKELLINSGFINVEVCYADKSKILNFNSYNLDMIQGKIRKPDSLFMEAIKP